jgi:phosphodiesterase/alkaline phosphatase D-like protein
MSVTYLWVGATTSSGATVCARLSGEPSSVRLAYSEHKDLSDLSYVGPVQPSDDNVIKLIVDGLEPSNRYYFAIEAGAELNTALTGTFYTHPEPGSEAEFTIAASSCAGLEPDEPGMGEVAVPHRISNHPVFDTIRKLNPLMFFHLGDMHYYNIGSDRFVPEHDVATYRGAINDVFAQDHQHSLYRSVATFYTWDDHDFGPNDSDRTSPGAKNACRVYRERVPHYPLDHDEGIWQAWTIGRVQFAALDVRSQRSPNEDPQNKDKTMLGAAQKEWLAGLLEDSEAEFLVVLSGSRWFDDTSVDTWDSYHDERNELIELFKSTGWQKRMCIVSGDVHAVAIDSGGNSPGGIPLFQFASLDAAPSSVQHHYDLGPSAPGRNQYGTLHFEDSGDRITVTGTGYHGEEEIMSHKITVDIG